MIDPFDVTAFCQLTGNRHRTIKVARVAQPQRERRVLGIAEPIHHIELNR